MLNVKRLVTTALLALTALVTLPAAPAAADAHSDFINAAGPPAQASRAEFGVPASVTVAQAILESGWGQSALAVEDKNYFGIKCGSSGPGPIAIGCVTRPTTECTPTCHTVYASFRRYASMLDSFRDHGAFLRNNPRYANAFNYTNNPNQFVEEIRKAGYATDPAYTSKVVNLMTTYNLYRFDRPLGASLSGDGRTEIAMVLANGDVKAWRNGRGFTDMPWDADAIVGTGFTPDNAFFADLDGDGRKEIIVVLPNGDLKAWHNDGGFKANPWGANVIIGTGFTAGNTFFADLNADGRSEVLMVMPNGDLKAWRNGRGFAAMPWDGDVVIGSGFTANNTFLADLNADGKAEAMTVLPSGEVKAWRNARGFAAMPWDADVIIATGFSANNLFLPDLDGDGKADITTVLANGDVKSWHNGAGFAAMPWNATAVIASGFSPTNLLFA
ncbi:sporangiospore maturation cell wall hydrolase GsmA [Kribbella sp. NBC_01245]|uniref:sporangiospore maturation cell wall hydrolase GsmA n=1 Tax=Kribbella sp. NBC_01245 TaxID=2903578 RepID=UPI002E2C687E|nr:sporangiospore maturation cell wall hydrolase GsmA [Kribbella sp. NBC_01245]